MVPLKIGMIGLDTSHCEAFVNLLHYGDSPHHVPGGRVVGAYPGGSQLFSLSRDRVAGFTKTLHEKHGIPIFPSIEELASQSEAFFLESVDGRQHLEQFRILSRFGKPVFIDKPFACSFADARAIADLAAQKKVPVMSCSAVRYGKGIAGLLPADARALSCETYGPSGILPDYPGYFWYGVHAADVLFSYMGKGCRSVQVIHGENLDLLVGLWADGRMGTLRGIRFQPAEFGCTVFSDKGVKAGLALGDPPYYALMLKEVMRFFQTAQPPIDVEETVEIMAFLEAAGESLQAGGETVALPG